MNPTRILLTRIIAINWFGFQTIIDVTGNVVISGETGTGKSALLDLIQRVMLGHYCKFNQAATGEHSERDLRSYCLCDTKTEENGVPKFCRNGGITLIGLEFRMPDGKYQTWGQRIEYDSPSSTDPKRTYFWFPARIGNDLVQRADGKLLADNIFRKIVKLDYGGVTTESQEQYLNAMALHGNLHFRRKLLNKTMPQCIAFEPKKVKKFNEFARELILEPTPVDVTDVTRSLHVHRDYTKRLAAAQDQLKYLERIAAFHLQAQEQILAAKACNALIAQFSVEQVQDAIRKLRDKASQLEGEIEQAKQKEQELLSTLDELKREEQNLRQVIQADVGAGELERAKAELQQVKADIEKVNRAMASAGEALRIRGADWQKWLDGLAKLPIPEAEKLSQPPAYLIEVFRKDVKAALGELAFTAQLYHEITTQLREEMGELANQRKQLTQEEQRLRTELQRLSAGRHVDTPLLDAIQSAGIEAAALWEVSEVTDEAWRAAVEYQLGRDRFSILVSKPGYTAAIQILKRLPRGAEQVLNPMEVEGLPGRNVPNPLAGKIHSSHPLMQRYLDFRLGRIECVKDEQELERVASPQAITPDCIFKTVPVRRKIGDPERIYSEAVIGQEARHRAKENHERDLKVTGSRIADLDRKRNQINDWITWAQNRNLHRETLQEDISGLGNMQDLLKKHSELRQQVEQLSDPERVERAAQLAGLIDRQTGINRSIGKLEEKKKKNSGDIEENAKEILKQEGILQERQITAAESPITSEIRGAYDRIRTELTDRFSSWERLLDEARTRKAEAEAAAQKAATDKILERIALKTAHTIFADEDEKREDNIFWDNARQKIIDQDIPSYEAKAQETRKEWEVRLKDNVLSKLQENLESAEATIKEVNAQLRQPIGGHTYVIHSRRRPEFDDVWYLLDQGFGPGDEIARASSDPRIQSAIERIMSAVETPEDPKLRELLDYRAYRNYDMKVRNEQTNEEISVNRQAGKFSGGESQSPFVVAMLAAHLRAYQSSVRQSSIGLVVMDEAFSKLSSERIGDCMEAVRDVGLQLIIALPNDKFPSVIEQEGIIGTVVLCRMERTVSGEKISITNDAIPCTFQEAMEKIHA